MPDSVDRNSVTPKLVGGASAVPLNDARSIAGCAPGDVEVLPGVFRANQIEALRSFLNGEPLVIATVPIPLHQCRAAIGRALPHVEHLVGMHDTDSVVTVIEAFE